MSLINRRFIPPIVSMALFMEAVDMTIINTAIPRMAESLHVIHIDLKIALIGYLISLAVFIPISGWISDKFGAKRVFMYALCIFTMSSFFCGLSTHLWELVLARMAQGLGGSFMMPVGRLMIVQQFKKTELVQTMSRVSMLALIGPALGPILGGFITQTFSWRWIFWVNIPVGLLVFIFTYFLLPHFPSRTGTRLDKRGFLLFGLGLAGFTFGLSALSEEASNLFFVIPIIILSVILLVLYCLHARHQSNPLLNTALFKFRTFRVSIMGNLLTRLSIGAVPFLLPLMLQTGLGYSPFMAGLFVAVTAIGMMGAKVFSKAIISYFGFKHILLLNTILLGMSLGLFGVITHTTSHIQIILQALLFGFLISLQFSSMNPLTFSEVAPALLSNATSLHGVTLQVSQSLGVGMCALILKAISAHNHLRLSHILNFSQTFYCLGFITVLSGLIFLLLKKQDGNNLY